MAIAATELDRTLGTLRYLKGLQAARARAVAAQGPSPSTPLLTGQGARSVSAAMFRIRARIYLRLFGCSWKVILP